MPDTSALRLDRATLRFGSRTLWADIDLAVPRGEFLVVLGPNGSGKTSLLRSFLGLQPLSEGGVEVLGRPPHRGNPAVGYVPQQRAFDPDLPLRGRDLVALGVNGSRWGFSIHPHGTRRQVDEMLALVGALEYANAPIGRLSGGEQQRLRICQALIGRPQILLCDEPLLSLDLNYQQTIVDLLSDWNRRQGVTVLFVTHDINPVRSVMQRILLLAGGRWAVGHPDQILTSDTLSGLYGVPVEVRWIGERFVVLGAELGGHEPLPEHPIGIR
jgi:zinc/manganese transport system ATP-binding protein